MRQNARLFYHTSAILLQFHAFIKQHVEPSDRKIQKSTLIPYSMSILVFYYYNWFFTSDTDKKF